MTLTLQFILMIDTEISTEEVVTKIVSAFNDSERSKNNSCLTRQNFIEVSNNEDSDFVMSLDEEDGFLYYPIRLEATPIDIKVTEEHQIQLAQNIVEILTFHNCRVVVCANFEDKIH
jgi:hypothetical protein